MPASSSSEGPGSDDVPPDLVAALRAARHVVVLSGAGTSAESGIPTFRDALTGLWERFDAEDLATPEAFRHDPELVWGWYEWRRIRVLRAQPNSAHVAIAAMSHHVPQLTLVTQNVDDLHERAGSEAVLHLHGSLLRPRCSSCSCPYSFEPGIPDEPEGGRRRAPPACTSCGAPIRPGIIWFGEALPEREWQLAKRAVLDCDVMFSVGTSSLVYPAAGLPQLAASRGTPIVQINPKPTSLDSIATWLLTEPAGTLFPRLVNAAWPTEPSRSAFGTG